MAEQTVHKNVTGMTASRLSYCAAGNAEIETIQISDLKEENLLIKTLYSGISRGTESLVFHGKVPASEWDTMRCPHMAGSFGFPVTYGYACVGKVIETGSKTRHFKMGDHVFVLHPHQDLFQVSEDHCSLVPPEIPPARAVLSANMETALNAVWDAEISGKPKCAVIGAGVVGLATAHVARELAGLDPVVIDINPAKKHAVTHMGFEFADPHELDTAGNPTEFELLFHTSASAAGLQTAIDLAGFEAKIIEMSWYGDKPVKLNLGGKFHSRRLQLISTQVGTIAPAKRKTHTYRDRMAKAISMLADSRLDILLEDAIDFHDLPDHVHDMFSPASDALCQVIAYTTDI